MKKSKILKLTFFFADIMFGSIFLAHFLSVVNSIFLTLSIAWSLAWFRAYFFFIQEIFLSGLKTLLPLLTKNTIGIALRKVSHCFIQLFL